MVFLFFHRVSLLCVPEWNHLPESATISSILRRISWEYGKDCKESKGGSVGTKLLKFLARYRNTPYSVNGRTPEEILLGKAPGTQLSLFHPCIAREMSVPTEDTVGSQSPRTFVDGQVVYLHDLHPSVTGWWVPANIVHKLESFAYEVDTNGHRRQAHVDHLKPHQETRPNTDTPLIRATSTSVGDERHPAQTPLVILNDSSTTTEQPNKVVSSTPELAIHPQHNQQPPHWSIEEMS